MQYKAADDTDIPLCRDCSKRRGQHCTVLIDVVDGEFAKCMDVRASTNTCGPEGKWFVSISAKTIDADVIGDFEDERRRDH